MTIFTKFAKHFSKPWAHPPGATPQSDTAARVPIKGQLGESKLMSDVRRLPLLRQQVNRDLLGQHADSDSLQSSTAKPATRSSANFKNLLAQHNAQVKSDIVERQNRYLLTPHRYGSGTK